MIENRANIKTEFTDERLAKHKCSRDELWNAILCLLFASGEAVSIELISECTGYSAKLIKELMEKKLQEEKEGEVANKEAFLLRKVKESYTLVTNNYYGAVLEGLFTQKKNMGLSKAAYEVLAAVAYNQPVTRAQLESIRGVNSDSVLAKLEERGYISCCGVLEQLGRPSIYEVTEQFLLEMNIRDVKDLPPMDMLMYSTIRELEKHMEEQ